MLRRGQQTKRRKVHLRGEIKAMISSFILGLILCTPVILTPENDVVSKQVVDEPVSVISMETRTLNLSGRSAGYERYYGIINDMGEVESKSFISYTEEEPLGTNVHLVETVLEPEVIEEPEPEVVEEPEPVPVVINTRDINKPSNLTAEQFNQVINTQLGKYNKKNSKLYGIGNALYQVEQTYGNINGLFVLSIISNESGWGMHLANTNNVAGITKKGGGYRAFGSVEECVIYTGGLLSKNYIGKGLTTIAAIGNKYCPDTPSHPGQNIKWRNTVTSIMNQYSSVAENLF